MNNSRMMFGSSSASVMYKKEYIDYIAATVYLLFIVIAFMFVKFSRNKNGKNHVVFTGHTFHWLLCSFLFFLLALEVIENVLNFWNKNLHPLGISRITCIVFAMVSILSSLLMYNVCEQKFRINFLILLHFLWLFMGLFSIFKATVKFSSKECSGQFDTLLQILITVNCFMLLICDVIAHLAMKMFKTHKEILIPEGVKYANSFSCFLSKISYNWMNPVMLLGFKKPLEFEDLGVVPPAEDVELYHCKLKKAIEIEKKLSWDGNRNFSLWRCYWKVSKKTLTLTACLQFVTEVVQFLPAFMLEVIISSFKREDGQHRGFLAGNETATGSFVTTTSGDFDRQFGNSTSKDCPISTGEFFRSPFALSCLMFSAYVVQIFMRKYQDYIILREGIRLKSALQTCIFEKSLSLKMATVNEGKLMNHMTVDATQTLEFALILHFIWSLPLLVVLSFIFLSVQLGKSGSVGCLTVLLLCPVQYLLGRYLGVNQEAIMETSDKRLFKTNEMLQNIKLLKMYAWENLFCQGVVKLRSKEVGIMWKSSVARTMAATITDGIPSIACILTFVMYYFVETTPLTVSRVFSSTVVFVILANQLFFLAIAINMTILMKTSAQRLRSFFLLPEIQNKEISTSCDDKTETTTTTNNNHNFNNKSKADEGKEEEKRTLLSSYRIGVRQNNETRILDHSKTNGFRRSDSDDVKKSRKGSDATERDDVVASVKDATFTWSTNPALFDVSFELRRGKLVMLFGSVGSGKSSLLWAILGEMEKIKGAQEFCKLPLAFVSQKAWILSATIRENILFGLPYDERKYAEITRAVSLTTDFDLFPDGDASEIGEKGANLSGGQKQRIALARCLYQDAQVYLMDDSLSALDPHVAAAIFDQVIVDMLIGRGKTVLFVTHNSALIGRADEVVVMAAGRIAYRGDSASCPSAIIDKLKGELDHKVSQPSSEHSKGQKLHWKRTSTILPDKFNVSSLSSTSLNFMPEMDEAVDDGIPEEESLPSPRGVSEPDRSAAAKLIEEEERQTGATPIYYVLQYVKYAGAPLVAAALVLYAAKQGVRMVTDYYLALFIDRSDIGKLDVWSLTRFCLVGLVGVVLIPISVCIVEYLCLRASKNIHNKIIHSLAAAPMRFFDTTPIGRILNRMSADLNILDLVLNSHLDCFLFLLMFVLGSIFINGCFNPYFLLPVLPVTILAVVLQRFYIASTRELQRLDCTSKSLILAHFSQVLSGLHVIRTTRNEKRFRDENLKLVNKNVLPLHFQYVAGVWMALRLDLLGATIVLSSCICSLIGWNQGFMDANAASLVMLYAICNCFFVHWAMKYLSDLEIYSSNIQRLIEYCNLPGEDEDASEKILPPPDWPSVGQVEFQNVSLTYDKSLKPVVEDVNLNIPAGQKVGICGRTGSGKSTLTLGLFRLVDICEGKILLDGRDISTTPIRDLRSRLAIIPQDPVLFSGTVRFNLDPMSQKSDEQLWHALRISQLHELISKLPMRLESEVSGGGCSLSIGQRQLFCIARALLRQSRILVMDEATASVDQRTDQAIQTIIKKAFKDRTVLTIAHRISTIINSDEVMVVSNGRIIEQGNPKALMAKDTNFAAIVESG